PDLHQGHAEIRLHGIAERAESARDRAKARLAVRHHVDLVFPVPPRAETCGPFWHAALAGPHVHRAVAYRQRRHRLLPDPERAGGRGRNPGYDLRFGWPAKRFQSLIFALTGASLTPLIAGWPGG